MPMSTSRPVAVVVILVFVFLQYNHGAVCSLYNNTNTQFIYISHYLFYVHFLYASDKSQAC